MGRQGPRARTRGLEHPGGPQRDPWTHRDPPISWSLRVSVSKPPPILRSRCSSPSLTGLDGADYGEVSGKIEGQHVVQEIGSPAPGGLWDAGGVGVERKTQREKSRDP